MGAGSRGRGHLAVPGHCGELIDIDQSAGLRARPVHARVAKHNTASIRVLQKCGFAICGEDKFAGCGGEQGEEFILILEANEQIEAE